MNKLKRLRESKNLSVRELGTKTDINYGTLSRIENGSQQLIEQYVVKLADFFKVSADELLGREYINEETTIIKVRDFNLQDIYRKLNSMTENELISLRGAIDFVLENRGNNPNLLAIRNEIDKNYNK